jgi:hypothetical protein
MFGFSSNQLGCLGSIVVSIIGEERLQLLSRLVEIDARIMEATAAAG